MNRRVAEDAETRGLKAELNRREPRQGREVEESGRGVFVTAGVARGCAPEPIGKGNLRLFRCLLHLASARAAAEYAGAAAE